jgi:hypothetical protein
VRFANTPDRRWEQRGQWRHTNVIRRAPHLGNLDGFFADADAPKGYR